MRSRVLHSYDAVALLVGCLVICSIALVNVRRQRTLARQGSCLDNLRQIMLGTHNYHSAYRQLPMGSGGTDVGSVEEPWLGNANRLSPLVGLLPFLEQQRLWEQIANPLRHGGETYPAMGPAPWLDPKEYEPWGKRPAVYVCPAEPDAEPLATAATYVINYGDGVYDVGAPMSRELEPYSMDRSAKRGAFLRETRLRFRDFLDGLSNTLLYSETRFDSKVAKDVGGLPLNPSLCIAAGEKPSTAFWPAGRNGCWADGSLRSIGFQTILPPNSPSATSAKGELEGVMSASSHHASGAHVAFADARIQFVLDSIDAGDPSSPSVAAPQDGTAGYARPGSKSPYGLWGAIGTRGSREPIDPRKDENIVPPVRELSADERQQLQAKPLESWTTADGSNTFQARQLEIKDRSTVILMTKAGDIQRIKLSKLQSEDAYRAVEQDAAEKIKARRELIAQLQEAVDLLDKKQIVTFLDQFVVLDPNKNPNKQQIAKMIEAERGNFIQLLETTIRTVKDERTKQLFNEFGNEKRLPGGLQVRSIDGRWRIILY